MILGLEIDLRRRENPRGKDLKAFTAASMARMEEVSQSSFGVMFQ
jgi:hypothetical protein